jgi:hypothetical protein
VFLRDDDQKFSGGVQSTTFLRTAFGFFWEGFRKKKGLQLQCAPDVRHRTGLGIARFFE